MGPLKTVADILALNFARLLLLLLRYLPERIALELARGILAALLLLMPRARGVARRNLEIAFPELSTAEREAIIDKSYYVIADNLLGFARIPDLTKERALKLVDFSQGTLLLDKLRSEAPGRGIIIATMHYGPFETLVQLHQQVYGDISMLARSFTLPRFDRWWNARRKMHGAEVYSRAGAYNEMVRRLSEGQVVALLCDQNVKVNHATFANFFGIPAATTKSVALAAMRTGAPVIVATCWHRPEGDYELLFELLPAPESHPGTAEERIQAFSANMNSVMEKFIRAHPEQWLWIHRRWKTRPAGEAEDVYD